MEGSGSGSRRPKNLQIRNTDKTVPLPMKHLKFYYQYTVCMYAVTKKRKGIAMFRKQTSRFEPKHLGPE